MKAKLERVLRILLGVAFIVAGTNHFRDAAFYLRIMPDFLPAHALLVQLSGVTEMLVGLLVLVPRVSHWGARLVAAHLVVFLSVHFWMVQHAADLFSDIPLAALWLRIALQGVLIAWAVWLSRAPAVPAATSATSASAR